MALETAVEQLINNGMFVVVAAGNENSDACNSSPAGSKSAITVASSDNLDNRSVFSNWGSCVDIFAPGTNIPSWNQNGNPWVISGTSMASPHVAGVVSLLLSKYSFTPMELKNKLVEMSTKMKIKNTNGSPNNLLFVEETLSSEPTNTVTVTVTSTATSTNTVTSTATSTNTVTSTATSTSTVTSTTSVSCTLTEVPIPTLVIQ